MSKLQAPDKEATARFSVDMSESLHRKLSMLAPKTERKKVDRLCGCCWRMDWKRRKSRGDHVFVSITIFQDLRNCHKSWRVPRTKKLDEQP